MHGVSLATADDMLRTHITGLVDDLKRELGDDLLSVLLHGSLAMGAFYAPKSDVDLLVIVQHLTAEQARQLYSIFEYHHARRPYVGGLEVSVVHIEDAKSPVHPLRSQVHFSETTTGWQPWQAGMPPTDEDLIAHLAVAKYRGRSLYGLSPDEAIGELQWADYLASVHGDIDWILEGENILSSPFYCVLNLCRWMMMAEATDRIVPGKEEAGVWAMTHLPGQFRNVVDQALAAYRSRECPHTKQERQLSGGPWDRKSLLEYRDYVRSLYRDGKRAYHQRSG